MKNSKKLSNLIEIPRLETDQEGMLCGGFATIASPMSLGPIRNDNCDCNSAQNGCTGNGNCDCNGACMHNVNCNCDCQTTPAPPQPSPSSSSTSENSIQGMNLFFLG